MQLHVFLLVVPSPVSSESKFLGLIVLKIPRINPVKKAFTSNTVHSVHETYNLSSPCRRNATQVQVHYLQRYDVDDEWIPLEAKLVRAALDKTDGQQDSPEGGKPGKVSLVHGIALVYFVSRANVRVCVCMLICMRIVCVFKVRACMAAIFRKACNGTCFRAHAQLDLLLLLTEPP